MKQKTRFKNFWNIGYRPSVHEWPIYRYDAPKKPYRSISTVGHSHELVAWRCQI